MILGVGSVMLGLVIGVIAYFISNFIYFIIIFPVVIGGAAMIVFQRLIQLSKIRHPVVSVLFGILTGIFVSIAFYGTPYLILRNKVTANYQEKYQLNARDASTAFDSVLEQKTGSSGFIGYMKLRAAEGDEYSQYMIVNSMPIPLFSFSLKSTGAWLYWLLESVLFIFPIAWLGYDTGKRSFNYGANDWYNITSSQIGSVRLEDKQTLLSFFKTNDDKGIAQIIVPEGQIKHPMIEVYRQDSNNKKGDILISLKETFRKDQSTVKRTLLGQWEITQSEDRTLNDMLSREEPEKDLAADSI
jgi:hypothetical protein